MPAGRSEVKATGAVGRVGASAALRPTKTYAAHVVLGHQLRVLRAPRPGRRPDRGIPAAQGLLADAGLGEEVPDAPVVDHVHPLLGFRGHRHPRSSRTLPRTRSTGARVDAVLLVW